MRAGRRVNGAGTPGCRGRDEGHKEVRLAIHRNLKRPQGLYPGWETGWEPNALKLSRGREIPSAGLPSQALWNIKRAYILASGNPDSPLRCHNGIRTISGAPANHPIRLDDAQVAPSRSQCCLLSPTLRTWEPNSGRGPFAVL